MDELIEPKYYISEFEDIGNGPCSYISIDEDYDEINPEPQLWNWTDMMKWCVENLNGEFKVVMSGYKDFYIELYDENDAMAAKLRWA